MDKDSSRRTINDIGKRTWLAMSLLAAATCFIRAESSIDREPAKAEPKIFSVKKSIHFSFIGCRYPGYSYRIDDRESQEIPTCWPHTMRQVAIFKLPGGLIGELKCDATAYENFGGLLLGVLNKKNSTHDASIELAPAIEGSGECPGLAIGRHVWIEDINKDGYLDLIDRNKYLPEDFIGEDHFTVKIWDKDIRKFKDFPVSNQRLDQLKSQYNFDSRADEYMCETVTIKIDASTVSFCMPTNDESTLFSEDKSRVLLIQEVAEMGASVLFLSNVVVYDRKTKQSLYNHYYPYNNQKLLSLLKEGRISGDGNSVILLGKKEGGGDTYGDYMTSGGKVETFIEISVPSGENIEFNCDMCDSPEAKIIKENGNGKWVISCCGKKHIFP